MRAHRLESLLQGRGASRAPRGPGVRLVELPDATLRIRVAGERGPSIVIVPDPPNVIEHYDRLIELLAADARVVCVEAPGFGFSRPRPNFDFTLGRQAETMATLLATLGWKPHVLVFPCFAGLLAVRIARDHPDLVSHVVLVQTASWEEELRWVRRIDARGLLQTRVLGQLAMGLGKRRVARGWYRAALPPGADPGPFLRPALAAFDHGASYCLASAFQAAAREEAPGLGPISQPALVVWGGADRTHRRSDKRSILAYAPRADVVQFDAAGHFPDLEQPERFRDEVLHFLA